MGHVVCLLLESMEKKGWGPPFSWRIMTWIGTLLFYAGPSEPWAKKASISPEAKASPTAMGSLIDPQLIAHCSPQLAHVPGAFSSP